MARPKVESDKERVGIRLYVEDLELLRSIFPDNGYNKAVREIVHKICNKMRQQMADKSSVVKLNMEQIAESLLDD